MEPCISTHRHRCILAGGCVVLLSGCGLLQSVIAGSSGPEEESRDPHFTRISAEGEGPSSATLLAQAATCENQGCYYPSPPQPTGRDPLVGCGVRDFWLKQSVTTAGWGDVYPYQYGGERSLASCDDFPEPGDEHREEIAMARELYEPDDPNFVVVAPDKARWVDFEDGHGNIVERGFRLRIYERDVEIPPNPCGDGTRSDLFCEAGSSGVAIAFNAYAFHMDQANHFMQEGNKNACRVAAFAANAYMEDVLLERQRWLDKDQWIRGATYVLRDGEAFEEPQLLDRVAANAEASRAKFEECGGSDIPHTKDTKSGWIRGALERQQYG